MIDAKYLNPSLPAIDRAEDLLSRMSLEEKMSQIVGFLPGKDPIEQLEKDYPHGAGEVSMLFVGQLRDREEVANQVTQVQQKIMDLSGHRIPAIFHIETLTGGLMPDATVFPSGIGQASTWNPSLQHKLASVIRSQVRAVGATHAFAPVLDISRDSRFGRQGETYGEDPTLAAAMGAAYVLGLQNSGNLKEGALACAKHFLGYHATQGGIHAASTPIPPRALREVYAKPFQAAITKAGLKSVMNTYSSIDGEAVAGSRAIMTDFLRKELGFDGVTVSDYTSILELHTRLKLCESETDAGEQALLAGMDIELPAKACYNDELMKRIRDGKIDMDALDNAVRRVLIAKFKLGLFEQPFPMGKYEREMIFVDPLNKRVGGEVARQSLVLLKNNGVLPLKHTRQKIAVIGHHASSVRSLFGGYTFATLAENMLGMGNTMAGVDFEKISNLSVEEFGTLRDSYAYPGSLVQIEPAKVEEIVRSYYPGTRSLFEQLSLACPEAEFAHAYGYAYAGNDTSKHEEALVAAAEADLVILTLGGKHGWGMTCTTGEGIDATDIGLPECQESFIRKLAVLGKPTVAIHFDGRPISSDAADLHADAILEAWNPGQYGAEAIAGVLFGDTNPAGRLPVSVAYNAGQIPIYYNHDNGSSYHVGTANEFTSYVDCPREPRYYFGHGLSYTTFAYSNLQIEQKSYAPHEPLRVSVDVENTGDLYGEEVVQLYVRDPYASMVRPVLELAGFARIPLAPKEKKTAKFKMEMSQFAFLDANMRWKIESGNMDVWVGSSSRDIRVTGSFHISEDLFIDGKTRGFFADVTISK
ncbi:glycoside hydrolase family 3 N-terminal domain-containing protein [Cohnella herbarum]|uniref:Beta-glucosidase n=1 Tax=Cohnella herbarum TaxID=2728023 RepID=A0A7Z2ZMI2_9BACL|nr:glycoside hydrolase family 3 N-terminal domain-containing protein [Cohnella herbarum]QJD85009.1 beta-glucosidase [Cohnella herbarum]